MKNYIRSAVTGIKWSFVSRFGRLILHLVTTAILARLLLPSDFGLIAIATIFTGFVIVFSDLGTSAVIINLKEVSQNLLSTLFWVNAAFGIFSFIVIFLLSGYISLLFNEPELSLILKILPLSFIFSSLGILHRTLMEKELKFNQLAVVEIISALIASTTAIILAFTGFGVWSLVIYTMVLVGISCVLFWSFERWIPSFTFMYSELKKVLKFTTNFTGFNILNYFVKNADKFIIGKVLGTEKLGYYSMAYKLMIYPIILVSDVIKRVMFPVFSRIQNDDEKIARGYIQVLNSIALITFPALIGLMVLSDDFVNIVLGAKWEKVTILIMFLAPVGIMQSLITTTGTIYLTKSKPDLMLIMGLIWGVISVSAILIGLMWDIEGIAAAYLIANIIWFIPSMKVPMQLISADLSDALILIAKTLIISLVMALGIYLFSRIELDISQLIYFILKILVGIIIYVSITLIARKEEILSLLTIIRNKDSK